jgi:hypothetical protein
MRRDGGRPRPGFLAIIGLKPAAEAAPALRVSRGPTPCPARDATEIRRLTMP